MLLLVLLLRLHLQHIEVSLKVTVVFNAREAEVTCDVIVGSKVTSRNLQSNEAIVGQLYESFACSNAAALLSAHYTTVSFHNFKSQNFKFSVSNPKSKYIAYSSVLSQISNCQGLGRKNKHDILKTDRTLANAGAARSGRPGCPRYTQTTNYNNSIHKHETCMS